MAEPRFWWVVASGEAYDDTVDATATSRRYHVGAEDADAARASVEGIELQHATEYGATPWTVETVEETSRHVDPSGEANDLYGA
jgi:hypothetical protein